MAIRNISDSKTDIQKKKRSGIHSKNASKSQNGYKPKYRGQGR
mgnify:CR=1 FL=1|jgi:hypothetical protein